MRRSTLVLTVVAALAVLAAVTLGVLYATKDTEEAAPVVEPCQDRIFGLIASLEPSASGGFEMRLDPAWFTTGVTANTAAAEDGVVEPGEPVPNDNYRVDEGHRLLTYLVPDDTEVTVLTRKGGDPAQIDATSISVEQLSQLVAGETPVELYEPLETGVWVSYHVDTTCAIDHQYQP